MKGFFVLPTVERRKSIHAKCPQCQAVFSVRSHEGSGVAGVPDLLVRGAEGDAWPKGRLLGLEVKKPSRWRWSGEGQLEAWRRGAFHVVTGTEELERLLESFK